MFLSIIIPVYKVEPYLRECLESIAVSELDCWEAILIDDGSPDGCPQICDEYAAKDNRFRVIHQKNAGVAAARNAGLDVAQGQWCWFVDSDDVVDMRPVEGIMNETLRYDTELTPTKHEASFATKTGNDVPVDLVMFDLETIDGNGNVNQDENKKVSVNVKVEKDVSVERDVDVPVDKNKFLLENVIFHHQRLWYRSKLLNQYELRFTKGVRLAEDLELMYKYMTLCQHPVKIDTTLYYYREREGSATQNDSYRVKAVEDLQVVLGNLAEWIRKYNIQPEPWLDFRIMKLYQNLLYCGSVVKRLDMKRFQTVVRNILASYRLLHFPFVTKLKYKLADNDVSLYFLLNSAFLRCKRLINDQQ